MKMRVSAASRLLFQSCLACFLVLSMFACKPVIHSELFGTYIADYDIAKEKLTLNKNGTFIQEVTFKATSKVDVAKGTWVYNFKTGYVSFEEYFILVLDGFKKLNPDYAHPKPGGVSLPADKYFGWVFIGAAEGILYKKVD